MNILPDGKREVTFPELWNAIGGGVTHTMEKVLTMMANSADAGEDFLIVHGNIQWIVRRSDIEEYFKTHQRPSRPLSLEAEAKMLRKQNEELRLQLEAAKGGFPPGPRPAPGPGPAIEYPARDPAIPVPGMIPGAASGVEVNTSEIPREKMTPEALQDHLKKMVSGVKPQILRDLPEAKKHDRSPIDQTMIRKNSVLDVETLDAK